MGATSWRYYTEYQPDAGKSLQVLRSAVFERHEYVDVLGPIETTIRKKAQLLGEDPDSELVRSLSAQGRRLQQAIKTGVTEGLNAREKRLAQRVVGFRQFATKLGAILPKSSGSARSIDELLERSAECGTHSILDIERVARRPGFGVASPLSRTTLRRLFQSDMPTHEQTESRWGDIAESLSPWQARYFVVVDAGQVREYAFIGCSGD